MVSLWHFRPIRLHGYVLSCFLMVLLATSSTLAAPIDEFRISDIEQKLRDLETTTREQARLIAQLQSQTPGAKTSAPIASVIPTNDEQRWLKSGNWAHLKPGMSELQVIELLGVPTQVRSSDDGQTRSLLYAMEIGRSGFLSGKVELQSGKLTLIELPHLK